MRDPYLYDDVDVLRNLGNIKSAVDLRKAEGDITKFTMATIMLPIIKKLRIPT